MPKNPYDKEITPNNASQYNVLQHSRVNFQGIDNQVLHGLTSYIKNTVKKIGTPLTAETADTLISDVVDLENLGPLFSGKAFDYPAISEATAESSVRTSESSIQCAYLNGRALIGKCGLAPFIASDTSRQYRLIEWGTNIGDDFQVRLRGASGASAISLDLGLGVLDAKKPWFPYKELWRCGIDTEQTSSGCTGTRFVRTGSGIKPGDDFKTGAFKKFRREQGIMPQRLLGLVGLYVMREFDPDYAVALSLDGAINFSTLGKSKGITDYDAIFRDIGFKTSKDPNWNVIPNFHDGFYDALDRADLRKKEVDTLDQAVKGLRTPLTLTLHGDKNSPPPLNICSSERNEDLERELRVFLP